MTSILTTPKLEATVTGKRLGEPIIGEPIKASIAWAYVIVRTTRCLSDPEQADTVNIVYGPYDEQGASAAYRKLVAAGLGEGASKLHVRGLCPTGDARSVQL